MNRRGGIGVPEALCYNHCLSASRSVATRLVRARLEAGYPPDSPMCNRAR